MEMEVNPDIVKATQESLGKYVKRPPLTEKLLKKPPFRFLHDIITSVFKSTGFFNGLFDEEELIFDNVKDRERKILFLNKIITVIGTTTGKSLSVKPSKIIAGQEPEKTNELLQCLALALDNNLSSDEAVKLYKESVKLNTSNDKKTKDLSPVKKSTDARIVSSRSSDKSVKSVKSDNNGPKLKQRDNTIVKKENSKKLSQPPKVSSKKVSENIKQRSNSIKSHDSDLNNANLELTPHENLKLATIDTNKETDVIQENNTDSNVDTNKDNSPSQEIPTVDNKQEQLSTLENNNVEDNLSNNNSVILDLEPPKIKHDNKEQNSDLDNEHHAISSPKETETEHALKKDQNSNLHDHNTDNIAQPQENKVSEISNIKRPSSVRPPSSRPGAPRLREKHDTIISSADNLVAGKVNIIAETTVNDEEDESTIILMDNADTANNMQEENVHLQTSDQHGHLVQQILDAQKEFTQAAGKTEIEWHFGAQKARDVLNQEIEQIRFNVQALSRVANPLGKLLDHIQEDVEVMRQELQQWTASYDQASKELLKQKVCKFSYKGPVSQTPDIKLNLANSANEEYLLPLIARIKQLDVDIAEKHDKINDLRLIIHKNSSRIDKLLSSGTL